MKKVKVFYNQSSGKNDEEEVLNTIKKFFDKKENQDFQLEFVNPDSPEEAVRLAKKASQEKTDLIMALGGDGTINKICGGVFEAGGDSILGIIPNGTVNNLSKSLHIPQDIEAALENLKHGRRQKFDIAKVNDEYMISSLTLGILADIAQNVSSTEKKKFGPFAYLKDAYKVIRHNKSYHIELKYNGKTQALKTKLLLITMTDTIGGRQALSLDAKVDDGLIRVYSLKEIHLLKILFHLNKLRKGKVADFMDITYFDTDHLEISTQSNKTKDVPYSRIDGDKSSPLPLDIKVYRKGLTTIVPK
ncbi:diacylglycerol/lipid kinase family protein [Lactococcus ileimucosae]|uniref:diacylglycerol/lipid kinase family protein n=1 Tax=Lactococcus ileimucosae TaxID=2941329 RepID=UPI0020443E19|nr:diacylglycerol kinase family protein [Lactococcus ileimucosae]